MSVVQLAGCDAVAPPDREQLRRQDPASPWHVHDHFKVVVEQAEANNLEAVSAGLQRYFPEREDFIELFGKARGEAMWTGYREVIMPTVRTEGAEVLAKRVKAGMTTVELERVGPMFPGRTTRGDHAMFQAMVTRRPIPSAFVLLKSGKGWLNGCVLCGASGRHPQELWLAWSSRPAGWWVRPPINRPGPCPDLFQDSGGSRLTRSSRSNRTSKRLAVSWLMPGIAIQSVICAATVNSD